MKWNAPNVLTLFRMILIPFFILFYFTDLPDWNIYAAIIFIVAAITDWLDGFLARRNNQVTNFGKLWDPIADKLLVLAALLLLMAWGKVGFIAVLILEARELIKGRVLENNIEYDARTAAEALAKATRSEVVQVIGTKFVLYRESHSKPREKRIQLVKAARKKPL